MSIKHEVIRRAKNNKTEKLVIMLHGVGSNCEDLISLADYFNLNQNTTYLSPNAPYPYDRAPIGFQWFSLRDYSQAALFKELNKEAHILRDYIEAKMLEYKLTHQDIIVLGFSQGAMLALYCLPRMEQALNAVIAISGAMVNPSALASEVQSKPDILLIHGDMDQVVPYAAFHDASKNLKSLEFNVDEFVMNNTGHNINSAALNKIQSFLKDRGFS